MTLTDAHEKLFDAKQALRCADNGQIVQRRKAVYNAMAEVLKAETKENKNAKD